MCVLQGNIFMAIANDMYVYLGRSYCIFCLSFRSISLVRDGFVRWKRLAVSVSVCAIGRALFQYKHYHSSNPNCRLDTKD